MRLEISTNIHEALHFCSEDIEMRDADFYINNNHIFISVCKGHKELCSNFLNNSKIASMYSIFSIWNLRSTYNVPT
jgi:hypothetical protein